MNLPAEIFQTETVRYGRDRWSSNNGFRLRWLANGAAHATAINAARAGDLKAVLRHAESLGGLTQKVTFARGALRAAAKLDADVPPHRIIETSHGERMVCIPNLTWQFLGNRQVAKIEWLPMWGARG